ncbi:MAG: hypothetical protein HC859_06895 [Bacteroidia bacterium]|nr:hypothetical protein [Bacteroidia bacterium]
MEPIRFNPLKHHADHICNYIQAHSWDDWAGQIELLGSSVIDIYTGNLTPAQIADEVIGHLKAEGMDGREAFFAWVRSHHGYRMCMLSDGSLWVLRESPLPEAYVHIHPGRRSPQTLRLSANTLKTAITCVFCLERGDIPDLGLESINKVRTSILDLSGIHTLKKNSGAGACAPSVCARRVTLGFSSFI